MKWLRTGLLITPLAALALWAWMRPSYNWDMLPYIGVSLSFTETDEALIHRKTYESARETVPRERYEELTGQRGIYDPAYRRAAAADAGAFHRQLGFYRAKPLYSLLILVLARTGLDSHICRLCLLPARPALSVALPPPPRCPRLPPLPCPGIHHRPS